MSVKQRIGVLCGGLSNQRDLSIRAGEAVAAALVERGHDAMPVFVDREVDLVLRQLRVDTAVLALRGRFGTDGCLQGLLEMLGVPYTGSGVLASGLAMNRAKTKEVLRLHNLPTAPSYPVRHDTVENLIENHGSFGFPAVIRPVGAGPGPVLAVAHDEMELEAAVDEAFRFDDEILVERFIEGRLVSVGVLDGLALGALDLGPVGLAGPRRPEPSGDRGDGQPSRFSAARYRSLLRLATLAYEALGCEGAACVEMVVSERCNEVLVDVDAAPLLLPTAVFPRIAATAGLSFSDLVDDLLAGARLRAHGHRKNRRATQLDFSGPERRTGMLSVAH